MSLVGVNLSSAEFAPQEDPGTYGINYTYPTNQEIDYYASKGMTVIRLPFLMDRMQDGVNGPLDQAQLSYMDAVVTYATSKGLKIILDPHDYGYEHGTLIADQSSDAAFANFWGQMAAHFKSNPSVIFGLENEPHVQTASQWLPAVNAAIAAIRSAGATQEALIPAVSWESAAQFTLDGSSTTLASGVTSSLSELIFPNSQMAGRIPMQGGA
jgi:endoglucanase